MSVIYLMIPAALLLAGIGVVAFIIAAKKGQFDDLDTPALRAVFDDEDDVEKSKPQIPKANNASSGMTTRDSEDQE